MGRAPALRGRASCDGKPRNPEPQARHPCGESRSPSESPGTGALRRGAFELPRTTRYRRLAAPVPGSPSDTPSTTLADGVRAATHRAHRKRSPLRGPTPGSQMDYPSMASCETIPEHPERYSDIDLATADRGDRSVSAPYRHPCGHRLETTHRGLSHRNDTLAGIDPGFGRCGLAAFLPIGTQASATALANNKPRITFRARKLTLRRTSPQRIGGDFRYPRHGTPCEARCPEPLTPYRRALSGPPAGGQRQPTDCLRLQRKAPQPP